MRILVVHRVVIYADALAHHLTGVADVARVDVAYSGDECVARVVLNEFDAVLMPRSSLEESARQRRSSPTVGDERHKKVVVAADVTPATVAECIVAGMDAIISINQSPAEMVGQLVDIIAGRMHLGNHPFAAQLLDRVEDPPAFRIIAYHDAADIEIVRLVAAGLSDKEISNLVHYSGQTVRNRISRILQDSNIANRTQLAMVFLRNDA